MSSITASDDSPVDAGAAAALDAIYGCTWNKRFENEQKEIHGDVRNLKEFYVLNLKNNYPIEDVIQVWDLLPIFVPTQKGNGKGTTIPTAPAATWACDGHSL